jgi:serine/threonine protein kinase
MSNSHSSQSGYPVPGNGSMPSQARGQEQSSEQQIAAPVGMRLPETGGHGSTGRLLTGTTLSGGRYQIERLLAAGGMGAVYRALDTRFKRPCAVKEMLDHFQSETERVRAVEWFEREATLLLELNHPYIPRVRDFFAEEGRHYLVMDLISGRTLSEVLEMDARISGVNGAMGVSEERARVWTRQLCNVLGYLHRQDLPVIFRDLKPTNVMVTDRDEVRLIDFGIARPFQATQQVQATMVMTRGYAPPEQLLGQPEPRSDLYSLGVTIHRILTRHDVSNNRPTPFSFPPVRTLRPDITPQFEQILQRAMEPDMHKRWSSAEEMEQAVLSLPPLVQTSTVIVTPLAPTVVQRPASARDMPAAGPEQSPAAVPVDHMPTPMRPVTNSSSLQVAPVRVPPSGSITSGPANAFIADAVRFLAERRFDLAYDAVTRAHSLEPDNARVHQIFGQVFVHRTPPQADLALRAYIRALQLKPDDAETHKLVGDVWFFINRDPKLALPAYIQASRLRPEHFETHELLGQCYEKMNNIMQAIDAYREAVRLAPLQPEMIRLRLYFELGQLAQRAGQFAVAEYAFVQVLVVNAADHQTRFLLSQVYEREGKLEDAWRECIYVVNGPMRNNPGVQQHYFHLKNLLGR